MSRTQWILAATLILQALLLLVAIAPWTTDGASQGSRTLFPELGAFTAERIEILGGEEGLKLDREGDAWVIAQAGGYPADPAKIEGLLSDLEQIEVRRPVVSGSRYHAALKVTAEENERRVRVWGSIDGEPEIDLLIGTSPNYGVQHVRRVGEDRVYDIRGLNPWDLQAEPVAWVDRQLLDVAAEEVVGLTLTNAQGRVELRRSETGEWETIGSPQALDRAKIDPFLSSIGRLQISKPVGRFTDRSVFGLEDPAARLELVLEVQPDQTESVTVSVGGVADEEDGTRYARLEDSEYAVTISKWDAERLIDASVESWQVDGGD